jgi:RNA recognition motif-containing protein
VNKCLHLLLLNFIYLSIIFRMNIYVSNFSFNVEDDDLRGFFEEYGEVTSAKVITDKMTQRSRGFGFVEMTDSAAAEKAISELDGASVQGRNIRVTVAKPKEERSTSGGGYNNNNKRSSYSNNGGGSRW